MTLPIQTIDASEAVRPMRDAPDLEKRMRQPGSGLTPDKKDACTDHGPRSGAQAALATLAGGPPHEPSSVSRYLSLPNM